MPSLKEAVLRNIDFIKELDQRTRDGFYSQHPDVHDCLLEAVNSITMQAEHLQNSSIAIAESAQKLLHSVSGKR